MSCPRCGFSEPGPVECPRCGVVFAKLERAPRRPPARLGGAPGPRFSWFDALLVAAFVGAGATIVLRWTRPPAPPRAASVPGARSGPVSPTPGAVHAPTETGPELVPRAPVGSGAGSPGLQVPSPEEAAKPPSVSTEARELAPAPGDEAAYRALVDAVRARGELA